MTDLIIGSVIAGSAYLLLLVMVLYNRYIIETIHKKQMSHIREIKSHLNTKPPSYKK